MGGARGGAARGLAQEPVKESAGAQMDSRTILEEDRHGNTVTTLERSGSQYGPRYIAKQVIFFPCDSERAAREAFNALRVYNGPQLRKRGRWKEMDA